MCYTVIKDKPAAPVPMPVNLVKYIEDPDYEHEDFTLSSAITLRARVGTVRLTRIDTHVPLRSKGEACCAPYICISVRVHIFTLEMVGILLWVQLHISLAVFSLWVL